MQRKLFAEEHELFRESVRRFVQREVVPHQPRWNEAGIVDRETWRKAGAEGLLCPWLSEDHGGPGGDFLHSVVVMEELARVYESGFALPLHSELAEHADDCAVVAVRALARVPLVGVAGWPDARARLDLVLAEGLVPARWLWRAGVHQYLLANEEAVRDIGVWYARHVPSEEEGHRYFFLLLDAVDGDVATPRAAWPRLQAWTNPTYRWVVAEALRVRGDHEEATALLREVVDLDAGFVAAALSLASSQLQRGRVGAARITCDVLRLNAPPLPIYQFWQSRLEQRLGITGDAPDEESEPE